MPLSTVLFAPQYVNAGTKPLGYPDYFAYALIFFKVAGATALMLPMLSGKLRECAYAGLTFNLILAVISHAAVDGNAGFIMMPVVVGLILAISYIFNTRIVSAHSTQSATAQVMS